MNIVRKIFYLLVIMAAAINLSAQESDYENPIEIALEENSVDKVFPPLAVLIDSAITNSPDVILSDSQISIRESNITEEKREWMQSISVIASANYGQYDNLTVEEDWGMSNLIANTQEQTRYTIGLSLRLPLSRIADRSNVITAQEELSYAKNEKLKAIQEIRKQVIEEYNDVIKSYKTVIIYTEEVQDYKIQVINAEKEYKSGIINSYEYIRLKNMLTQSQLSLENSKIEFSNNLQILEETVGYKFY